MEAFLGNTGLNAWDVYSVTMSSYDGMLYVRPVDNLRGVLEKRHLYAYFSEEESEDDENNFWNANICKFVWKKFVKKLN